MAIVMKKGKRRKTGSPHSRYLKIGFVTILFVFIIAVAYFVSNQPTNLSNGELKAAILDSLYIMDKNPDFLSEANQTLSNAGFKVDIYLAENVTVDLFRQLPSLNYKIIVLRVHTAWESNPQASTIAFFTGTPYNNIDYFVEQWMGEVREGIIDEYPTHFFATTEKLIEVSEGTFPNSIVVVDSCYGLNSNSMAEAFVKKGALVYISWDKGVYSSYSDDATLTLVSKLLDGMTVEEAVNNTPSDTSFGSELSYYPYNRGSAKLM